MTLRYREFHLDGDDLASLLAPSFKDRAATDQGKEMLDILGYKTYRDKETVAQVMSACLEGRFVYEATSQSASLLDYKAYHDKETLTEVMSRCRMLMLHTCSQVFQARHCKSCYNHCVKLGCCKHALMPLLSLC